MRKEPKSEAAILRQKAEKLINTRPLKTVLQLSETNSLRLIHELEVHQIELEMQNAELELARSAAKIVADKYIEVYDFAPSGYFTLSKTGKIIELNLSGANMLGKDRSQLINSPFRFFVSSQTGPIFDLFLEKVFNSNSKETSELTLSVKGSLPIYVYLTGIVTENGEQCLVTMLDITKMKQAELAQHNSQTHLQTLMQTIPDLIWLKDANGMYLSANPMLERVFGAKAADIIGKTDYDLVDRELADLFNANDRDAFKAGKPTSFEEWVTFAEDGHRAFINTIKTPVYDSNGMLLGVLGIGRDITEHKLAEQVLIDNEMRFRAIFDQAPVAIALIDLQGHPIISNLPLTKLIGYSSDELSKMKFTEFTLPEDIDKDMNQFNDLLEGKIFGYNMEKRYVHKNGTIIWANLFVTTLRDKSGRIQEIIGMIEDITERKQTEQTLLKLSSAVEQTIDSIIITDRDGTIEYVNHAFELLTGYSAEEVIGKTPRILKSGMRNQTYYKELWKTILSGDVFREEVVNKKKNGDLFYEQKTISPIFDKNRIITHFVGTGVDISERKLNEKALQESEKLYRSLFENMLNGFAYCKMIFEDECPQDFIYLAVNNSFEVLSGLKDVSGKKVSEVVPGIRESDPELFELYGRVALAGKPETIEIYVQALKMWFSISVYSPEKEYFVAIFDVITERKNTEEMLRQSEAKFKNLINSLPDPVLVVDSQGRIVFCNENAVKTFDYNIGEMLNCTIEDLIPNNLRPQHITHRNVFISEPKSRAMGEGKELFAKRKGGSEFPTEIMLEPVEINGNQFTLAIVRDITARKSTETEIIEAKNKAEESDRLKSAFLANMSHEVRTPLNSIIGFSELLADPFFEEEEKTEFIQHIVSNGRNLLSIISDIMDISKMESGEITIRKSRINAREFVSGVKDQFFFQAEAKKLELKLSLTITDDETVIYADSDRLMQIFNNLISNAIKFTANGFIEIGYRPNGKMVEFYVKDTGIGIPAEYHGKIFDRFRQLEDSKTRTYGGNGLGLSIAKNLVELMGGKIRLESEPENGSVFYFTMPEALK